MKNFFNNIWKNLGERKHLERIDSEKLTKYNPLLTQHLDVKHMQNLQHLNYAYQYKMQEKMLKPYLKIVNNHNSIEIFTNTKSGYQPLLTLRTENTKEDTNFSPNTHNNWFLKYGPYGFYIVLLTALPLMIKASKSLVAMTALSLLQKSNWKIMNSAIQTFYLLTESPNHKTEFDVNNPSLHTFEDAITEEDLKEIGMSRLTIKFVLDNKISKIVIKDILTYVANHFNENINSFLLNNFEDAINQQDFINLKQMLNFTDANFKQKTSLTENFDQEYKDLILLISKEKQVTHQYFVNNIKLLYNLFQNNLQPNKLDEISQHKNYYKLFKSNNDDNIINQLKGSLWVSDLKNDSSHNLNGIINNLRKTVEVLALNESFCDLIATSFSNSSSPKKLSDNNIIFSEICCDDMHNAIFINNYNFEENLIRALELKAMNKIFSNQGKPYYHNDHQTKKLFELAINKCYTNIQNEFYQNINLDDKDYNSNITSLEPSFYLFIKGASALRILLGVICNIDIKPLLQEDRIIYEFLNLCNDSQKLEDNHKKFIALYEINKIFYKNPQLNKIFEPLEEYKLNYIKPAICNYLKEVDKDAIPIEPSGLEYHWNEHPLYFDF